MAQTQAAIAETIASMKAAMKRKASDSGSDTHLTQRSNRGHKLQRRARNVQQHRLDDTGALRWRKRVNHAGYMRHTISTNPRRYDQYGYPVSDDDELDDDVEVEEEEDNPFGKVKLEELLRPLNSAADLAEHPSLKLAFESKALTQMAQEAAETLRGERASLWKAKKLIRRFRGDGDWVPCGLFETDQDELLLGGDGLQSAVPSITAEPPLLDLEVPAAQEMEEDLDPSKPIPMEAEPEAEAMEGIETTDMATAPDIPTADPAEPTNGNTTTTAEEPPANPTLTDLVAASEEDPASSTTSTERHAMTTRTRARARSPASLPPSPSPSDSASIPSIHPWFIPPAHALSDRDFGIPPKEAEETRKFLLMYVQKQEQICRSLEELCSGLMKADRLREWVYRSAKAEGHVTNDGKTEMSDGEDWYDVRDWGMEEWEVLEKGKDEVEDVEEERRGRAGRGRRVNRI